MYSILPGAIQRDLAGEKSEKCSFAGPDRSGRPKKLNLWNPRPVPWNQDAQLTKRRMRTFIATPSARNVNNTEDPP
jgi:hypothetical protein